MLEHGGRLLAAAAQFKYPLTQWLDLSTGINSHGYPVPAIPPEVWLRLPESEDGLLKAAQFYYGTDQALPTAGSQAAIQALPMLRAPSQVALITPGYNEHMHAWQRCGHQIVSIPTPLVDNGTTEQQVVALEKELRAIVDDIDVLVLCNPNNPTGVRFSIETLLELHESIAHRGGWLVVDETFADDDPKSSLTSQVGKPGLIVLRSLGKFFGLAGARVGFVLADNSLLKQLNEQLGPWTVSGPARWVASQALTDQPWQQQTRASLITDSQRLCKMLVDAHLNPTGSTSFFQWIVTKKAQNLYDFCSQRAILIRHLVAPNSVRIGLPGNEVAWERLNRCLSEFVKR